IRQLGRRMTLQSQRHLLSVHAGAVVGDFDQIESSGSQADGDRPGAGIDGVLDQFLERGGWPLDHFAGSDSVNQVVWQTADQRHSSSLPGGAGKFEFAAPNGLGITAQIFGVSPKLELRTRLPYHRPVVPYRTARGKCRTSLRI